jgi:hypothetical protein
VVSFLFGGSQEEGAFLSPDGDVGMEGAGVVLGLAGALDSDGAFLLLVVEIAEALIAQGG